MNRCPPRDDLILFADDGLPESRRDVLARHVEHCSECRATLDAVNGIDAFLSEPEPLPAGVIERLHGIPDAHPQRHVGRTVALAIAAAVLLTIGAGLLELGAGNVSDDTRSESVEAPGVDVGEDATDRFVALRGALETGDPLDHHALPALLGIAKGDDVALARLALLRLGDLGRSEALPGLFAALADETRRPTAIEALARLGDEAAVGPLAPYLADPDLAGQTLLALTRIGGAACAAVLADRIETIETETEARPYVLALAEVDGSVGARALARLLDRSELRDAVLAATHANSARLVPHLVDLARGRDADAAFEALAVLEHLAPIEVVPDLTPLLDDRRRRSAAARVLARIDTAASAAALFAASSHDDVRAAFQRCGPRTEAWLRAKLEDPRHQVRRDAVDLLARCGAPDSIPALRDLATDRALAPIVIAAIGRIGGQAAIDALDALSAERKLLAHVVDALGATGARGAVAILERIGQLERSQRAPAIEALARIPHADAVTAILALDTGRRLRSRTTRALLVMDRDVVTTTLTALLYTEDAPRIRQAFEAMQRADSR